MFSHENDSLLFFRFVSEISNYYALMKKILFNFHFILVLHNQNSLPTRLVRLHRRMRLDDLLQRKHLAELNLHLALGHQPDDLVIRRRQKLLVAAPVGRQEGPRRDKLHRIHLVDVPLVAHDARHADDAADLCGAQGVVEGRGADELEDLVDGGGDGGGDLAGVFEDVVGAGGFEEGFFLRRGGARGRDDGRGVEEGGLGEAGGREAHRRRPAAD